MRKTKIIATIGPATRSPERMRELFDAGCNVIRINMSHTAQEEAANIIADVRTISDRVAILLDTKGPEIRTTEVERPVMLERGSQVVVRGEEGMSDAQTVRVTYREIARAVDVGTVILVNDGRIELEVTALEDDQVRTRVIRGGELKSRKGVNIPDVKLKLPFMSSRDESDIRFGVRHHVDFIAASFVGDAEDVLKIKEICESEGGRPAVISKVESRMGVRNLAEIIAAGEGVMVARGDLGVEIRAEEVPVVQKQIVESCRGAGKVVIIATEMLESMISEPRPTRAETSDVANAIFEGADAVMLSGETGVGKFPIDAVRTMARIAENAEKEVARKRPELPGGTRAEAVSELICKGAWLAARELKLKAILVPTSTGATAMRMSRFRPPVPILATTPDLPTARRMALSYGVFAIPARHFGRMENMVRRSCQLMVGEGYLTRDDVIAVVAGVPVGRSGSTNLLTIQQVSALMGPRELDAGAQE